MGKEISVTGGIYFDQRMYRERSTLLMKIIVRVDNFCAIGKNTKKIELFSKFLKKDIYMAYGYKRPIVITLSIR